MNILAHIESHLESLRMEIEKHQRYLDDTIFRVRETRYIADPDEAIEHILTPGSVPYWQRLERLMDEVDFVPDVAHEVTVTGTAALTSVQAQIYAAEQRIKAKRDREIAATAKLKTKLNVDSFLENLLQS